MSPPVPDADWDIHDLLLRSVTHDLANPLTVISSYVTLLLEKRIPDGERELILRRMKDNSDLALKRMGEVRNFVQQKRRLGDLELAPLPLLPGLHRIAQDLTPSFSAKGVVLELPVEPREEVLVLGAPGPLMEFVLRPILANALKFSRPGSTVKIAVTVDAHKARVLITDQGIGISSERLQRKLLSPTPGTDGEHGPGFSLLLARHVLQLLGGELHLTSDPGLGTRVTIALKLG